MEENLLEVKHLSKKMKQFALQDINFSLKPGYIMGLLGVNGSGKTTLLNTILNLYQKDCGEVFVGGYSMEKKERLAKDLIGFVMDRNMFEENLTVAQNARMFGKLYKCYDEALFYKFCQHFGVPLKRKILDLSTGMKTRFQLAFALSHDARLFIMDEPASGLDPKFRKELMHYMQEIVEDGSRSVIFSTHITEDLEPIGDYILLMKDGKIVLNQSIEQVRDRYLMLQGSKEEMEQLSYASIIYREYGICKNIAMVRQEPNENYKDLRSWTPKLEEIMYCLEKGGYDYV